VNSAEISRAVRQAVMEEFDLGVGDVALLRPGSLPRTTSGKIRRNECRRTFLSRTWSVTGRSSEACRETIESGLAGRLRHTLSLVLRIPDHWIESDKALSALGLDSLMRLECLLRLEAETCLALDPDLLKPETTLKDLTEAIQRLRRRDPDPAGVSSPVNARPGNRVPLLPIQHELLGDVAGELTNQAILLHVRSPRGTQPERLQAAFRELGERHDAFRLRIRRSEGAWLQEIGSDGIGIAFQTIDARNVSGADLRALGQRLTAQIGPDLNLQCGPAARAVFLDRGDSATGVLFLSLHPLVADAMTIARILFELEQTYEKQNAPRSDPTFREWAECLDGFAQTDTVRADLPFWRDVCTGNDDLSLVLQPVAGTGMVRLTPDQSSRFLERFRTSQEQHDFLLNALARAWSEITGGLDLFVRLENHGRFRIEGKNPLRVVGRCTCHFPMRVRAEDDVGDLRRSVPHDGLSFGLLRYCCRDSAVRAAMKALPVPQVAMTYRGRMDDLFHRQERFPLIASAVLDAGPRIPGSEPALTFYAGIESGVVWWRLACGTHAFTPTFTEALKRELQFALSAI
jgi:acyl carrier protein